MKTMQTITKRTFTIVAFFSAGALFFPLTGCTVGMTTNQHRADVQSAASAQDLTLGKVQREIRRGMSGAEVAQALGSPNIVTKDESGMETWVYDKIATEVAYSQSNNGLIIFFYGESSRSGAASVTQRTLTVVIKFNPQSRVEAFSYHSSKF